MLRYNKLRNLLVAGFSFESNILRVIQDLIRVEHLFVLHFIRVGSDITRKYQTRPEKNWHWQTTQLTLPQRRWQRKKSFTTLTPVLTRRAIYYKMCVADVSRIWVWYVASPLETKMVEKCYFPQIEINFKLWWLHLAIISKI